MDVNALRKVIIQHKHPRFHNDRTSNGDTLALSTRKLMRIAIQEARALPLVQANFGQSRQNLRLQPRRV